MNIRGANVLTHLPFVPAVSDAPCAPCGSIRDMDTDVEHQVRGTRIPKTRPLMPVFEAIVNSIHAIEDGAVSQGLIRVEVLRAAAPRAGENLSLQHVDAGPPQVTGFVIRDNGVGFNSVNFASFNRSHSGHKRTRGGKGVGRFLWLAGFRDVLVKSVYRDAEGKAWRRQFRFSTKFSGGVKEVSHEPVADMPTGSEIHLNDLLEDVAKLKSFQHDAEKIAETIAEHCTGYLLRVQCPRIEVIDGGSPSLCVNEIFANSTMKTSDGSIDVAGESFRVVLVKARPASGETQHRVRLYADCREVKSYSLAEDLPQLPRRLVDEGKRVADVYVFGAYLDKNVDHDRNRFYFEELDSDGSETFGWAISMVSLKRAIAHEVGRTLFDLIEPARDQWRQKVKDHIQNRSPRYNALLRTADQKLDDIPFNISTDRLEGELARILYQHTEKLQRDLDIEFESDNPIQEHVSRLVSQVQEVQRNQLAEYVLLRHAVLAYMRRALRKDRDTQKWPAEAILHNLIFPKGHSSSTLPQERSNLWVFDERLSFGDEVLSDLPIDASDMTSRSPDLLVFDRVVTVADGVQPRNVMMFEFKRPGRDDYGPGLKHDPVFQLKDQVQRIREGSVVNMDGEVRNVSKTVPIFAYLIADSTDTLRKHLRREGWIASADHASHVALDMQNMVIYQHFTWSEALAAAVQRNKAFFEHLSLPPP